MNCKSCGAALPERRIGRSVECDHCGSLSEPSSKPIFIKGGAELLVDSDGNGIPDLFEGKDGGEAGQVVHTRYEIEGVTYDSLDDMPPHIREEYGPLLAGGSQRSSVTQVGRGERVSTKDERVVASRHPVAASGKGQGCGPQAACLLLGLLWWVSQV